MNKIYLGFYKGKGNFVDRIIRFFTKGKYSHCELIIERKNIYGGRYHFNEKISYDCYSSSPRDGGVRLKNININSENWDLVQLENVTEQQIISYFQQTKGKKYDLWGAIGVCLGIKDERDKYFCSEWCFNVIFGSDQGWRFSPNQLSALV
ncbi:MULTISPECIES: enoyl-CoA hydratase [Pasteurellaceae]|uniref:Enoyl-CoA hydratase n=1 Tax=Pasteurella atlantica TaxID=2827233 RepID=A0AAW8CQV7_9PAST|nr:enoyl-CoA hydratase [Pasteurella atlantica]MBR0573358.1 enoyl-CoA hydratase [Pasteurella atlantica]MDP8039834.1 enoyl-CoA hydratase [Pasteurella atlantica]MDP8041851.1 enoyl-CoA hydratase [Pasteurella atlantica]MDP8043918.1 enoyl-CoA hydratase [Pasteurella atlantica]MDP8046078.1 enoyl-CoA hydratase [Pasteurella atlantica]